MLAGIPAAHLPVCQPDQYHRDVQQEHERRTPIGEIVARASQIGNDQRSMKDANGIRRQAAAAAGHRTGQ
jgi:hypothetical protein